MNDHDQSQLLSLKAALEVARDSNMARAVKAKQESKEFPKSLYKHGFYMGVESCFINQDASLALAVKIIDDVIRRAKDERVEA